LCVRWFFVEQIVFVGMKPARALYEYRVLWLRSWQSQSHGLQRLVTDQTGAENQADVEKTGFDWC